MKQFFQEFKKHWLLWGTLFFLILLFGYLGFGEFLRWYSLNSELGDKKDEIAEIQKSKEGLLQEIAEVQDPNFLEKEARLKLNLKKEGEEVFVVIGLEGILKEENFKEDASGGKEGQDQFLANIISWYNYFFNP